MAEDTPTLDFLAHWLLFVVVAAGAVFFVRRARKHPTRGRLIIGNVVVLFALLGLAIAAAETYLRFIYDSTHWHAKALTNLAWFERHVEFNEHDLRDAPFVAERPLHVTRIGFVGDSFTFGYGIKRPEDRFSDLVFAALDAESPGAYQVWNLGVIGATTGDEIELLGRVLGDAPINRIILAYSPNDVEDLLPEDSRDRAPFDAAEPGSLRSRSYLLDQLTVLLRSTDTRPAERYFEALGRFHASDAAFAAQAERIRHIATMCRTSGVELNVVVFPLISHWGPDYPYDAWHERINATWNATGIETLDLRPIFGALTSAELRVGALDPHPNERANRLVADAILARYFGR